MKGIYLASFLASHPGHDIIYQDINGKRDMNGDMMDVDLSPYDYIIATPPCNWWSRANYRRNSSKYALETKHLLIDILHKLVNQDKPFIVENVLNSKFFKEYGLFDLGLNVYKIGRHTYWSNIKFEASDIIQSPGTIVLENGKHIWPKSQNASRKNRQGGEEVHQVIERFIETIERRNDHGE